MSSLWFHLRRDVLDLIFPSGRSGDYERLQFPEFDVLFHLGLADNARGVGRVSAGLLGELRKRSAAAGPFPARKVPEVFFFPAVHTRCPRRLPPKSVVVAHDVTPLLYPELLPSGAWKWTRIHGPKTRSAARVIGISRSSLADVVAKLGLDPARTGVMFNGVTPLPAPAAIPVSDVPYFCFLGTPDGNKNLDVLLRAMSLPGATGFRLHVIGAGQESLSETLRAAGLGDRVILRGRLDDREVAAELAGAVALLVPSRYEGFGLPPFEAALLGTPSVCAARPAMNELLEGAAVFCDPDRADEWVTAMGRLAADPGLRETLASEAARRAAGLTWERAADMLLPHLEAVAKS